MPPELAHYITAYGYLAIFSLVFLQEIGVPNPVSNELVLIFSGYLASTGILSLPIVLFTVIMADFAGTSLLYFVFYYFGSQLIERKPHWLPISREHIEKITERVSKRGRWGIFVGRLIPFLRGYASVAAGLLEIPPKIFLPTVITSAILWSGGYVVAGQALGPYWRNLADKIGGIEFLLLIVLLIVLFIIIGRVFSKHVIHKHEH